MADPVTAPTDLDPVQHIIALCLDESTDREWKTKEVGRVLDTLLSRCRKAEEQLKAFKAVSAATTRAQLEAEARVGELEERNRNQSGAIESLQRIKDSQIEKAEADLADYRGRCDQLVHEGMKWKDQLDALREGIQKAVSELQLGYQVEARRRLRSLLGGK